MPRLYCRALLLTVIIAALAACSSTTLSGSWKDPDYRGQLRKVYIVGVAKQEINRRLFEDSFGRGLSALGVTGIASYRDLAADELDRKEAIVAHLQRNGADAILMARMIDIRTEQVTSRGYFSGSYFAPAPYYREWDSFYERRFDAVYQPAAISEYQVAAIEANLYDVGTGKLIWSAQLETVVDSDMDKLFGDFVKIVTRDLQQQGLL